MKIVLDASALEYLLKQEGEEFHLQIKAAALNAAAQHILTAVTPPIVLNKVEAMAYTTVVNQIGTLKSGATWHDASKLILKPEFQEKLQEMVKEAVAEAVKGITDDMLNLEGIKKQITERIARTQAYVEHYLKELDAKTEKLTKDTLTESVNKLIHKKVAEAVNKIEVTL